MSGAEGHTSARKRKDKKKSSRHRGADRSTASDLRLIGGSRVSEDDDGYVDQVEEEEEESSMHAAVVSSNAASHGVGLLSAFVFIILLGGLIALGILIFVGLKDSNKEVSTPIGESRYASILSDFVDEHEHDMEANGGEDDDDAESSLLHHDSAAEEGEHFGEEDEGAGDWGGQFAHSDAEDSLAEASEDEVANQENQEFVESTVEEQLPPHEEDEDVHISLGSQIVKEAGSPSADMYPAESDDLAWQAFDEPEVQVDEGVPANEPLADDVIAKEHAHPSSDDMIPASSDHENSDITNVADNEIRDELDEASRHIENWPKIALKRFEAILGIGGAGGRPESPRANYGLARSLDLLSEKQKSNVLLEQSIKAYERIVNDLPNVPDKLYRMAAERCVDRMRFRGFLSGAIKIQKSLIKRFPAVASLSNQLAITYLLLGQNGHAKQVLAEVLGMFPDDGFAKVHYGFILKTDDGDYPAAIRYLREGLDSGQPGTVDGRFYFHLGDALARQGRQREAMKVYEEGVNRGVFLSVYQRSLYNVASLTGRPWWTRQQLAVYEQYLHNLEENWQSIREEGLALLNSKREAFVLESEGLQDTGVWKQFELFARGAKVQRNCGRAPETCKLIERIPDAANCTRGQVKFSIMHPKTHVWAHTGPTNCRLRAHLGLVVPEGVRIRVANDTRPWLEGRFIVFDDSFEHEVWHDGDSVRLVLIVDFWHPELTASQKKALPPI